MTRLRTLMAILGVAATAAVIALAVHPVGANPPTALEAQVVDVQKESVIRTYATVDYGKTAGPSDDRAGTTKWRHVADTGNCCENYLTTSHSGRLFDFGGTYVQYTDDRGLTWKRVRPLTPLLNGEGTIAAAPNGDIIGIGWDPYSGDHLQAYKYEIASGKWFYNELPLKQPFYDREWVTVVPGPITIDGQTYPYISFLKGGYPTKELWLWSTDGLSYLEFSSKFIDGTDSGTVDKPLPTVANTTLDWIQPNSNTGLTPLGGGAALARPDFVPIGLPGQGAGTDRALMSHPAATSFSGAVTGPDGSCDTDKGPWIVQPGEEDDSVSVAVGAELTANDSHIHLKRNGIIVASQDTLTSPEVLIYDPQGDIPAGSYTVMVCDFDGGGAWAEPKGYFGLITFNEAGANVSPESSWALLDPATLTWTGYRYGDGTVPQGLHQVDGAGRVHNLIPKESSFDYRISTNGGQTWKSINVALPQGMTIEHIDFRASKAAGFAGVIIRADKPNTDFDQDLAYKINIKRAAPVLKRFYTVGLGDAVATAGLGNDTRMDFQTVTILPGGALAVSFLDSTTYALHFATGEKRAAPSPNVAIELTTSFR
jgi:hypothetical protein